MKNWLLFVAGLLAGGAGGLLLGGMGGRTTGRMARTLRAIGERSGRDRAEREAVSRDGEVGREVQIVAAGWGERLRAPPGRLIC